MMSVHFPVCNTLWLFVPEEETIGSSHFYVSLCSLFVSSLIKSILFSFFFNIYKPFSNQEFLFNFDFFLSNIFIFYWYRCLHILLAIKHCKCKTHKTESVTQSHIELCCILFNLKGNHAGKILPEVPS